MDQDATYTAEDGATRHYKPVMLWTAVRENTIRERNSDPRRIKERRHSTNKDKVGHSYAASSWMEAILRKRVSSS